MIILVYSFILLSLLSNFQVISSVKFTACPFFGHKNWITIDNKICYLAASYRLSWNDAEESCLQYNARLISIHDSTTNQLFNSTSTYTKYIWLGLNSLDKRGSYKWSDGSPYDYDNFTIQSRNTTEKPSINNQLERCVALDTRDGKWVYHSCNEDENYYCQKTNFPVITTQIPLGNCPEGWYEYANTKCIKIVDGKMTWDVARNKCISLDGEIVSIHSFEEQNFITALMSNRSSAWIGLEKLRPYSNYWTWNDDSKVTFTNWALYNPKEIYGSTSCAYLLSSDFEAGNWVSALCNSMNISVICQMDKDPSILKKSSPAFGKCNISGYENFTEYQNSCYHLSDDMQSWDSAENKCRNLNSELVSISDSFEFAFVTYYTQQFLVSDQFWTGFYAKYSNSTQISFKWVDKSPNFASYWAENQPFVNKTWDKTCVYQHRNSGNWSTDSCENKKYFMCKVTTNQRMNNDSNSDKMGYCPGSEWVDVDEESRFCYWFSVDNKVYKSRWTDALFECTKRKGTLASIHSYRELKVLSKWIQKAQYETWIGLFNSSAGVLSWTDSSPVDFTNFDKNLNNNNGLGSRDLCASVTKSNMQWVFKGCLDNYEDFICQIQKNYNTGNNQNLSSTSSSAKTLTPNLTTKLITKLTTKLTTITVSTTNTKSTTPQTTKTSTTFASSPKTSITTLNNTVLTTKSIVKDSTITTTNSSLIKLTTKKTTISLSNSASINETYTTNTTLATNSITNSTIGGIQSDGGDAKVMTTGAKVGIIILAIVVLIGISFSIYYILSKNNVKVADLFKSKPKTTEIALKEQGISKSSKTQ